MKKLIFGIAMALSLFAAKASWAQSTGVDLIASPQFGCSNNNGALNDGCMATMLGQCTVRCRISFGPGRWQFSSAVGFTFANSKYAITIEGAGSDVTELYWPNTNGGIYITYSTSGNGVHIKNMSLVTNQSNVGHAIHLTGAQFSPFLPSTIENVQIRGNDINTSWNVGVYAFSVSGLTLDNFAYYGAAGTGAGTGNGLILQGACGPCSIATNISNSYFIWGAVGITILDNVQGVAINNTNFTASVYGIWVNAPATGTDWLGVTNSQFNTSAAQIVVSTSLINFFASNNLFYILPGQAGLNLSNTSLFSVVGNSFRGASLSSAGGAGVEVSASLNCNQPTSTFPSIITGNVFTNLTFGIYLNSDSCFVNAMGNNYGKDITISVQNLGSNNVVGTETQ